MYKTRQGSRIHVFHVSSSLNFILTDFVESNVGASWIR